MRYLVGNGTKEEFGRDWYIAQGFGNVTTYGRHEGVDINLKTGGDTDLGRELTAISSGKIVYFHNSHPTTGYGKHFALKIDGPWGTRWVHYAHVMDDRVLGIKDVVEGQVIAKLGKTGTSSAHLHLSIFKVDPTLAGGLDNIANTETELNQYWEDPITFIDKWMVAPAPVDYKALYEQSLVTISDKNQQISNLEGQVSGLQSQVNDFNYRISRFKGDLKNYVDSYQV